MNRKSVFSILLLGTFVSFMFGYNPPTGGELIMQLQSPALLSGSASAAGDALDVFIPGVTALNPALAAGEQRIVLDVSYGGFIGFNSNEGYGNAFNASFVFPSRFGVSFAGVQGVFMPNSFENMPVGNFATVRAGFAKDLSDTFYVGAALDGSFGSDWGVNLSFGVWQNRGTLGFIKNFRWGASLTGLGKPYMPNNHEDFSTGYPSMFTLHSGVAGDIFTVDNFKAAASIDLSFPTFQNVILDMSIAAQILDMITIRSGWTVNLRETLNGVYSLIPSVGISVKLGINSGSIFNKNGWEKSEVVPSVAVRSLYSDITAFFAGTTVYLGLQDTEAPAISIWEE